MAKRNTTQTSTSVKAARAEMNKAKLERDDAIKAKEEAEAKWAAFSIFGQTPADAEAKLHAALDAVSSREDAQKTQSKELQARTVELDLLATAQITEQEAMRIRWSAVRETEKRILKLQKTTDNCLAEAARLKEDSKGEVTRLQRRLSVGSQARKKLMGKFGEKNLKIERLELYVAELLLQVESLTPKPAPEAEITDDSPRAE